MNLASTARPFQINKLERGLGLIQRTLVNISQDAATTYRDGGDGWTVVEVMCHMRDFEAIFVERAKLTVEVENADLPFPEPDKLAVDRNYNKQNLREVIDAWVKNRQAFLAYLAERSEADWARVARHPKRGPFSLDAQVFLAAWHNFNHLDQITKILHEKKVLV